MILWRRLKALNILVIKCKRSKTKLWIAKKNLTHTSPCRNWHDVILQWNGIPLEDDITFLGHSLSEGMAEKNRIVPLKYWPILAWGKSQKFISTSFDRKLIENEHVFLGFDFRVHVRSWYILLLRILKPNSRKYQRYSRIKPDSLLVGIKFYKLLKTQNKKKSNNNLMDISIFSGVLYFRSKFF